MTVVFLWEYYMFVKNDGYEGSSNMVEMFRM